MDQRSTCVGAIRALGRTGTRRMWAAQHLVVIALVLGGVWVLSPKSPLAPWDSGWQGAPPGRVCTVDQVLDGDSLRLICRGEPVEVRLHCIDAPEYEQVPWGKQSRRHLAEITPRRVELEAVDTDRFGRTVGNVFTIGADRRLLNLEQVASGNAAVYEHYCSDPDFTRAERAARATHRGIWSRPGGQQAPWVFRHREGR